MRICVDSNSLSTGNGRKVFCLSQQSMSYGGFPTGLQTNEMVGSSVDREVYEQLWAIVESNPNLDVNNRFISLIWSSYFDRQALAVSNF